MTSNNIIRTVTLEISIVFDTIVTFVIPLVVLLTMKPVIWHALKMEEASTSATSVNFYRTTRRNNPEDSRLLTRRRENLKSHQGIIQFVSINT
jgi:hypothetical protein